MLFFKNHFGMVVSLIIALILSLCMSTTAIFYNHISPTIEILTSNWGTAFLTIMLTTIVLPAKIWGDLLAGALKLRPRTLQFGLVSNLVPTFFYNSFATLVLTGVNVGFIAPFYWDAVAGNYLVMFVVSYFLSLGAEALAVQVAIRSCQPAPHGSVVDHS
jgi:hypothetical protein